MNNVPALSFTGAQLDLIRSVIASDCNRDEFELYIAMAKRHGLDPFKKEIYALVFSKDNPKKRRLALVVSIDGYRTLAYRGATSRGAELRPGNPVAVYEIDEAMKDPAINPKGIATCTVTWHVRDQGGDWYPVSLTVDWDEFAPLSEIWEYDQDQGKRAATGRFELAQNWAKQGKIMISKCAEAQVLRRVAPETLGGLYVDAEMDQANAWDQADHAASEARLERAGLKDTILLIFDNDLEAVPLGQVADRVLEKAQSIKSGADLEAFRKRNKEGLNQFWGLSKHDGLEVKRALEARCEELTRTA